MDSEWIIPQPWPGRQEFGRRLGVSPVVAQVLHNRGLGEAEAAKAFLAPKLNDLIAPEALPGCEAAADAIASAVRDGKRIVIYGDYDVDGIAASAILWHCLKLAGAKVDFYVPHRLDEGYGLNVEAIDKLADEGAEMIVTVDCGVTAVEAVRRGRERGVAMVITDHHAVEGAVPEDCIIVHPTAAGEGYGNPYVCGAGVAFKLAWSLSRRFCGRQRVDEGYKQFLIEALSLAGLGTIADVVQLVGENRIMARHGLGGLRESKLPGIIALIEQVGLTDQTLDAFDVGFRLGPRLNAAGRMGHARLAVELLTGADEGRSRKIVEFLEQQNRQRQKVEREIAVQAAAAVVASGMDTDAYRGIVVAGSDWHAGVIGIVASRLVDQFHKPVVMIAANDTIGQGSARSVEGFDMVGALSVCGEHLEGFGGHAMAAGLKVRVEQIPAFTEAFCRHAGNVLTAGELRSTVQLEGEVSLGELSEAVVRQIVGLGPFGQGNPRPKFASREVTLVGEPRVVGKTQSHLQLSVNDGTGTLKGIAFGAAAMAEPLLDAGRFRVAFEPMINEFNGWRNVEMQVVDFQLGGEGSSGGPR